MAVETETAVEKAPIGQRIREFFQDLLGSRLVVRLEEDLLRLRQDFEERLQDKERVIAELRSEKAALITKVTMYELTVFPMSSRAGADLAKATRPAKPNFPPFDFSTPPLKTSWQVQVEEHDQRIAKEIDEEQKAKAQTT